MAKFAAKLASQRQISVEYRVIAAADHFFNDHIEVLTDHVENYLGRRLAENGDGK